VEQIPQEHNDLRVLEFFKTFSFLEEFLPKFITYSFLGSVTLYTKLTEDVKKVHSSIESKGHQGLVDEDMYRFGN
jgi:hypothetical protein